VRELVKGVCSGCGLGVSVSGLRWMGRDYRGLSDYEEMRAAANHGWGRYQWYGGGVLCCSKHGVQRMVSMVCWCRSVGALTNITKVE